MRHDFRSAPSLLIAALVSKILTEEERSRKRERIAKITKFKKGGRKEVKKDLENPVTAECHRGLGLGLGLGFKDKDNKLN